MRDAAPLTWARQSDHSGFGSRDVRAGMRMVTMALKVAIAAAARGKMGGRGRMTHAMV